ncbi:MAG TPA: IS200/IS605 family transposase, partial [Chthoniobacterales bacterium]|nr:IS200/IS605 family transposase [Chthoniobacterales bacterium]
HVVFAVSGRACVIQRSRKEELQKYISGIVAQLEQKLIAISCMPDHTHILIGFKPDQPISDLVGKIKTGSTNFLNKTRWIGCRFSWQEGFGAFSVSHSQLTTVINYIQTQETHHRHRTFQDEYLEFLGRHHVPFDTQYIFKPVD